MGLVSKTLEMYGNMGFYQHFNKDPEAYFYHEIL
jgi:hypothetical protein